MMRAMHRVGWALFVIVAAAGCGSNKVLVPPQLDLGSYGSLAIVTFTVENARGSLHQLATERFAEAVLAAQPGIELLELGAQDTLVRRVGENQLGVAAAQELGRQRRVGAVFAGHLVITNPKASGGLGGLVTPHLEATVRADLSVRLLSGRSGGTVWRSSAWATQKVGQVQVVNGTLDFMAKDPEKAYGSMINRLVELVTEDMRSTWVKQ
jgi:hypothetical protein